MFSVFASDLPFYRTVICDVRKLNEVNTDAYSYLLYHLATILKFTSRGVNRFGIVNVLLAKSFINK